MLWPERNKCPAHDNLCSWPVNDTLQLNVSVSRDLLIPPLILSSAGVGLLLRFNLGSWPLSEILGYAFPGFSFCVSPHSNTDACLKIVIRNHKHLLCEMRAESLWYMFTCAGVTPCCDCSGGGGGGVWDVAILTSWTQSAHCPYSPERSPASFYTGSALCCFTPHSALIFIHMPGLRLNEILLAAI